MKIRQVAALIAAALGFCVAGSLSAQSGPPPEFTLDYWMSELGVAQERLTETPFRRRFNADRELPLEDVVTGQSVALAVSGQVRLKNDSTSLVRIVMVAKGGEEFLVLEASPLTLGKGRTNLARICEETCVMDGVQPELLRIEVKNAVLRLSSIATVTPATTRARARLEDFSVRPDQPGVAVSEADDPMGRRSRAERIREQQLDAKILRLNESINARGLRWKAGKTEIAGLSYQDRKTLLATSDGRIPNFQGFEYYASGIFETEPVSEVATLGESSSIYVASFDWRTRHGANNPGSPYYDGDTLGGGWLTSVKRQKCGDCWAHSAVGTTEAKANVYFNQHVDLDLSEQEMVSCSGAGSCSGGWPHLTLNYIRDFGAVDEACFPETGRDDPCGNKCTNPDELITIDGYHNISRGSDDNLKRDILRTGPIAFGVPSWRHALVAVGFQRDPADGGTIWILKNSWGPWWGMNGYGLMRVPLHDMYCLHAIDGAVRSHLKPREIACHDFDRDGYFNWGVQEWKPDSCPGDAPDEPDCDDWNPALGPSRDDGSCAEIAHDVGGNVTFTPKPETYAFSRSVDGCPAGFAGTFRFEAVLHNRSAATLDNVGVRLDQLSEENVLLGEFGPIPVGGVYPIGVQGSYSDGFLGPDEAVDVPFAVCLAKRRRFRLRVDVLGISQMRYVIEPMEYAWIDTSAGSHHDLEDDEWFVTRLGFPFEFFGKRYEEVNVGHNGYLSFGGQGWIYWNQPIPSPDRPNNVVAVLWDDLIEGDVEVLREGSRPNRKVTFSWIENFHIDVWDDIPGKTITFQATLYEDGHMEFRYRDVDFADPIHNYGASATVGVEDEDGRTGTEYSFNEPVLGNKTALRVYIPGVHD